MWDMISQLNSYSSISLQKCSNGDVLPLGTHWPLVNAFYPNGPSLGNSCDAMCISKALMAPNRVKVPLVYLISTINHEFNNQWNRIDSMCEVVGND